MIYKMANFSNSTGNVTFEKVSLPVVLAMRSMGCLIIVLNGVVLLCLLLRRHKLPRIYHLQLACLSFNDLVAGLGQLFISYLDSAVLFQNNFRFCSFVLWFFLTSQCATLYNILAICVSRLVTLRRILRLVQVWKNKHTVVCTLVAWVVSIVLCLIPFIAWSEPETFEYVGCSMETVFMDRYTKVMRMFCIIFLLPLVLTNILYVIAFTVLKKALSRTYPGSQNVAIPSSNTFSNDLDSERRMIRMQNVPISTTLISTGVSSNDLSTFNQCRQNSQLLASTSTSCTGARKKGENSPIYKIMVRPKTSANTDDVRQGNTPGSGDTVSMATTAEISQLRRQTSVVNQHRKTFIVLCLILVFLNIVTWPAILILVSQGLGGFSLTRGVKFPIFTTIATNSVINPFLYTVVMSEFRIALKESFWAMHSMVFGRCFSRGNR